MRNNKVIIILFLFLIIGVTAFSQATTNSPYSKYGIGIIRPGGFSQNFEMGGVGIGLRSEKNIGLLNPASYSALQGTTFDIGFTNNALWLEDGTESQYQNNQYIDHVAFAFPMVKNVWGMSFGVLPYSNVGYTYDRVVNDSVAGDVSIYNEGDGALNKVYLGNALALKLDSSSLISFGANAYFLFGAMNHDKKVIYGDLANSFNLWKVKEISVSDFGFDFGLQYQKSFTNTNDEKYKLTIGATYGLSANLDAKRTEILRTFTGNIEFGTIKDTVSFIDNVDDVIQLPSELGFGISFEKQKKWLFAVDYKTTSWSSIVSDDPLYNFKSNYSLAAGIQFIPKYDANNFLKRVAYRIGSRYSTSYISINDIDWSEYGITFGIGLPIRRAENSFPRLNLGIEYGNRGTTEGGLLKEKYLNFNLGVTINAVWFQKRKYD
jgi:hypothetical protein